MTNKLWEIPQLTEADEFRTLWTFCHNTEDYVDWVMNWFYPMALEHGMPEVTAPQMMTWLDENFGAGDRSAPPFFDDIPTHFATEIVWEVISYFNGLFLSLGYPKDYTIFWSREKLVYAPKSVHTKEVGEKAWYLNGTDPRG